MNQAFEVLGGRRYPQRASRKQNTGLKDLDGVLIVL
jgi:hypothetical protein